MKQQKPDSTKFTARLKRKKMPIFLTLLGLVILCVGGYFYNTWLIRNVNARMEFPPAPGGIAGEFTLKPCGGIRSVSGDIVYFDMGSRHSFITPSSLDTIQKSGYPVRVERTLLYTKDANGKFHWYTRKAIFDVRLPNPYMPDSAYYIRHCELLVGSQEQGNIMGMDVMKHLVLEHLYDDSIIRVYVDTVPAGYQHVADMKIHSTPLGDLFGPTNRASVELTVNDDDPRDYFFDTGEVMQHIEIVQPEERMSSATTNVAEDSVTGFNVQRNCRVTFGQRLRYSTVVYEDNLHTDEYSVNPLNLFDQDCVLDFPGRRILVRKTRE